MSLYTRPMLTDAPLAFCAASTISGTLLVLFGTSELLGLPNLSGQLARRSKFVHLRRYLWNDPNDREVFLRNRSPFHKNWPTLLPADLLLNRLPDCHSSTWALCYKLPMWQVGLATSAAPTYFSACGAIKNTGSWMEAYGPTTRHWWAHRSSLSAESAVGGHPHSEHWDELEIEATFRQLGQCPASGVGNPNSLTSCSEVRATPPLNRHGFFGHSRSTTRAPLGLPSSGRHLASIKWIPGAWCRKRNG